jgi:hypothetical protein
LNGYTPDTSNEPPDMHRVYGDRCRTSIAQVAGYRAFPVFCLPGTENKENDAGNSLKSSIYIVCV